MTQGIKTVPHSVSDPDAAERLCTALLGTSDAGPLTSSGPRRRARPAAG
ncbi:hypothetical protein [Actinoplanes regularis]|uniref:Uncharacterized protein n=1 Tax=Actinoplanes regularis TaxID=52697 RepID=A0A239BUZ5_9ACTN|nr:hypothetical protein [Actinoplanes regularis]SNS11489.1 hypothetical protein SAMN06264365_110137 [Actinoplanes regularis]